MLAVIEKEARLQISSSHRWNTMTKERGASQVHFKLEDDG
jgi:hypothetical protein